MTRPWRFASLASSRTPWPEARSERGAALAAAVTDDAVSDDRFRDLPGGRLRAVLAAEPAPDGLEVVHPRRQLRLLRVVGPAARLAPRAREHDRVGVGAVGRADRRRPRAPAPDAGRRGGAAAPARVVQVLRVLRAQRRERVRVPRAPSAAAAAAGAAADRHLVLHVHGDQLRRRRLALRDPGVAVARRVGVPRVLPAPDRRSDRPRRGADPADPPSARRGPDRRVASVVPDRRRAVQEDGDLERSSRARSWTRCSAPRTRTAGSRSWSRSTRTRS